MRFINYLQEKYVGSKKSTFGSRNKKVYSIYTNPTKLEMKFAIEESQDKELRFVADNLNKKIFVWSSDLLHDDVWDNFLAKTYAKGRGNDFSISPDLLPGNAVKIGNSYSMINSDEVDCDSQWVKDIIDIDWSWANKYVNVTKWLNKFKKSIKL